MSRTLQALLALCALRAAARADVLVVDATGAGDFTTVTAAIAAAAEGDTLLVRTDTNDPHFYINGKSLVIVGDVPVGSTLRRSVGGAVTTYAGAARSFAFTSPLRESQGGIVAMQGVPGDFVGFFWAFQSGIKPMPARNGWFLLKSSFIAGPFFVGTISSPAGAWDIPFTAPDLPPGSEAITFLLQAWFQYPGGVTLASGTAFTLVDQGF